MTRFPEPSEKDDYMEFDMESEPEIISKKGIRERIGDSIFNMMRGRKNKKKKKPGISNPPDNILFEEEPQPENNSVNEPDTPIKDISDNITQLKKPADNKRIFTIGLALLVFSMGSVILCTQLPTHLGLLFGIVMVVISGHILLAYTG
jgi:hypothetical protein